MASRQECIQRCDLQQQLQKQCEWWRHCFEAGEGGSGGSASVIAVTICIFIVSIVVGVIGVACLNVLFATSIGGMVEIRTDRKTINSPLT